MVCLKDKIKDYVPLAVGRHKAPSSLVAVFVGLIGLLGLLDVALRVGFERRVWPL